MSVGLLTKLLCLRIRDYIITVPDGIGKLTSLEVLEMYYQGYEEALLRRFVKELCGLRELRVLHLGIPHLSRDVREVQNDMVQSLCNLQKLEILSLTIPSFVENASWVWEAPQGFLLSRRLRRLSVEWITFSRSVPIILHQPLASSQPFPPVAARGLPELRFLDLDVHSIAEVDCSNTTTDDHGCCLFQKLRRCSIWYKKGIRLLLPSQEDSGSSVSFCMRYVRASTVLGSQREKAAGVAPTLMPSAQELLFAVYVQEFIKDGNHDDESVSLALGYFASLSEGPARLVCCGGGASGGSAAQRSAADAHPNRPTLKVLQNKGAWTQVQRKQRNQHSASTSAA